MMIWNPDTEQYEWDFAIQERAHSLMAISGIPMWQAELEAQQEAEAYQKAIDAMEAKEQPDV